MAVGVGVGAGLLFTGCGVGVGVGVGVGTIVGMAVGLGVGVGVGSGLVGPKTGGCCCIWGSGAGCWGLCWVDIPRIWLRSDPEASGTLLSLVVVSLLEETKMRNIKIQKTVPNKLRK